MNILESQHNPSCGDCTDNESHRVLIVDDEPAICFAYCKLLESELFGVDICDNIESATSLLRAHEYFAIISDVRFEGSDNKDGVHFVSLVRQLQPCAKVVLVTGYGSEELKRTAYELGISHYFEKPVIPSSILALLRAMHVIADEEEENDYFKHLHLTRA